MIAMAPVEAMMDCPAIPSCSFSLEASRLRAGSVLRWKVTRVLAKRSAARRACVARFEARELSAFAACLLQAYNSGAAIAC